MMDQHDQRYLDAWKDLSPEMVAELKAKGVAGPELMRYSTLRPECAAEVAVPPVDPFAVVSKRCVELSGALGRDHHPFSVSIRAGFPRLNRGGIASPWRALSAALASTPSIVCFAVAGLGQYVAQKADKYAPLSHPCESVEDILVKNAKAPPSLGPSSPERREESDGRRLEISDRLGGFFGGVVEMLRKMLAFEWVTLLLIAKVYGVVGCICRARGFWFFGVRVWRGSPWGCAHRIGSFWIWFGSLRDSEQGWGNGEIYAVNALK